MNKLINSSKAIAILSFVFGTILLALQLYFNKTEIFLYPGLIFVIVAIVTNILSLLALIISLLGRTTQKLELLKTCGLVLLNIPIAILYFYTIISIKSVTNF
jgi:hypothetical protein